MQHADMLTAHLREANFRWAKLTDANLTGAELDGTNFTGASLERVNFSQAILCDTVFADCQDLHLSVGLADTQHDGPSCLDLQTMRSSLFKLPDEFLLGIGWTAEELAIIRQLFPGTSLL
jgi:uncharacterized protein YjbI with pentapeptide repeats